MLFVDIMWQFYWHRNWQERKRNRRNAIMQIWVRLKWYLKELHSFVSQYSWIQPSIHWLNLNETCKVFRYNLLFHWIVHFYHFKVKGYLLFDVYINHQDATTSKYKWVLIDKNNIISWVSFHELVHMFMHSNTEQS